MKFCPYCGGKIAIPEARFCMNCGKSLESFQTQAAAPAPAPAPKPVQPGREYSVDSKIKGTVLDLIVGTGDVVEEGYLLLTVTNYFSGETEPIYADKKSLVKKVVVRKGQTVNPNDKLVILAESFGDVEVLPPAQVDDDDFFGEFSDVVDNNPVNAAPSGDDFFNELDNAADREVSAAIETINEAENYFMRGEFQRAEGLLEQFIGKDIDRANYMLCVMHETGGDGIEIDNSVAADFLGEGDLCLFHMFNFFVNKSNPHYEEMNQLILNNLSEMEKTDDPFLKFEVGYYLGNNLGQFQKFVNCLKYAEQRGYWIASVMLGVAYQGDMNGKPDFQKSLEHFCRAAKKGIPVAENYAGLLLKIAPGNLKPDFSRAKKFLLDAAQYMNDNAGLLHLADIYLTEGNVREAIRWHDKNVSVNEDADSASQLGYILLNIDDNAQVPTDYQRALQLAQFALSRDDKDTLALFSVGWSYLIGKAVAANEDTARYYFNLAVQNGYNTTGGQFAGKALEAMNQHKQNQNSGGCFITTAVCNSFGKTDDCYELTTFRKFRDTWLAAQPDGKSLIEEYYSIAPRIVDEINKLADSAQIYKNIWQKYLAPCLEFIRSGDNLSCKEKYIEMVRELKYRFC